jgi:hypothetical protein
MISSGLTVMHKTLSLLLVAGHRDDFHLDLLEGRNWWDNSQNPGDIMDTCLSGDAAPEGRFNYRYATQ